MGAYETCSEAKLEIVAQDGSPTAVTSNCEDVSVKVLLSSPCPAGALQFAISHDASVLEVLEVVPSGVTSTLRGGQGPEIWLATLPPDTNSCEPGQEGVIVTLVASLLDSSPATLPAAERQEVATILYRPMRGLEAGRSSPLQFVDCLRRGAATEPSPNRITCGDTALRPSTSPGLVRIESACFRRGDCNADGEWGISDPITLLLHLFATEQLSEPIHCAAACDSNADGLLNLSDAIHELAFLFLDGSEPPKPFEECGPEAAGSAVGCHAYEHCQ